MIQSKLLLILAFVLAILFNSCQEDELNRESVLALPQHRVQKSELDQWIDQTFVPYGIEVIYRWDKQSVQLGSYAYPPELRKVRPVLEAIQNLWLELYSLPEIQGGHFLMGRTPVRIYLMGGLGVDSRGVQLVAAPRATATEMYVYNVNAFDPSNADEVYALMHTIHHQFSRRLTELYPYDRDAFRAISGQYFVSSEEILPGMKLAKNHRERIGVSAYANVDGFLTMHGSLSPEADFADIIAAHLCNHPQVIRGAEARAAEYQTEPNDPELTQQYADHAARAVKALQTKQAFVETYFKKTVGLSLRQMQQKSYARLNTYLSQHP